MQKILLPCYERTLHVKLNGVLYIRVPNVLTSGIVSLLQVEELLSYWQKNMSSFQSKENYAVCVLDKEMMNGHSLNTPYY